MAHCCGHLVCSRLIANLQLTGVNFSVYVVKVSTLG